MFDPHASVFDPQDERLRRARLDDWHHPLQAPTLPVCHVANLLGEVHLVDSQGQRVCSACALKLQTQPVAVPACRTRILRGNLGVWSHAKRFFNLWQVTPALTITARRFQLADNGGKDSLIVLPLLEDAHRLDELLRIDATARACIVQPEADVLFRMCSRVKTVCLCANFARAKDKAHAPHTRPSVRDEMDTRPALLLRAALLSTLAGMPDSLPQGGGPAHGTAIPSPLGF